MNDKIVRFTNNGYRANIAQIDRDFQLKENLNLLWDTYQGIPTDVVFTALETVTKRMHPANDEPSVLYDECKATLCPSGNKSFYGADRRFNADDIVTTVYVSRLSDNQEENYPIISQNKPWVVFEMLAAELGVVMGTGLLTHLRDYTKVLWDKGFRFVSFTTDLDKTFMSLRHDDILVTINYYPIDYRRSLVINSTI